MAPSSTAAPSENATKSAASSDTSAKKRSKLCMLDGSPLTTQDQALLAVLEELQAQGYPFRAGNFWEGGERTAVIILPLRIWKSE